MTEFQSAMRVISGQIPLVPLFCNAKGAGWFGKWHFNTSTDWVKSVGGPWNTREEAVEAVLKTGLYKLRPNAQTPHLDRV